MKSNIQNQRGYALFIVMGLMVLATIGVMATYKAASSYDEKKCGCVGDHSLICARKKSGGYLIGGHRKTRDCNRIG